MCKKLSTSCFLCNDAVTTVLPCTWNGTVQISHTGDIGAFVYHVEDNFTLCYSCMNDDAIFYIYEQGVNRIAEVKREAKRLNTGIAAFASSSVIMSIIGYIGEYVYHNNITTRDKLFRALTLLTYGCTCILLIEIKKADKEKINNIIEYAKYQIRNTV